MKKQLAAILTVSVLFGVLVLAGCAEPVRYPEIVAAPAQPTIILPAQHRIAGTSVQGRPIMYLVLGQGPELTLILATIHGNEAAGTPLVRQLADYLEQRPRLLAGRRVVLLPVANPDGMARNSRENIHGVDLNRNFEAANRVNSKDTGQSALSEPEARAIRKLILEHTPKRIVTIHQPLTCIDYDGPGQALAGHMAQYCDLPVKKLGARPGSLGSYAGLTLGIPIITVELPRSADALGEQALLQQYGKALLAAIVYPDVVE